MRLPPTLLDGPTPKKGKRRKHHKLGARTPLHFESKQAYHDYLAHIHIHGETTGHHHPVYIKGKLHRVKHDR